MESMYVRHTSSPVSFSIYGVLLTVSFAIYGVLLNVDYYCVVTKEDTIQTS